jgi:hypothetical protein
MSNGDGDRDARMEGNMKTRRGLLETLLGLIAAPAAVAKSSYTPTTTVADVRSPVTNARSSLDMDWTQSFKLCRDIEVGLARNDNELAFVLHDARKAGLIANDWRVYWKDEIAVGVTVNWSAGGDGRWIRPGFANEFDEVHELITLCDRGSPFVIQG